MRLNSGVYLFFHRGGLCGSALFEESAQNCQDFFLNIFENFLTKGNSESLHEQTKTTKVKNLRRVKITKSLFYSLAS